MPIIGATRFPCFNESGLPWVNNWNCALSQRTGVVQGEPESRLGRSGYCEEPDVDEIEDAESLRFNNFQQNSTRSPHQPETKATENKPFALRPGIRLGRRGSGVQIAPPRPKKNKPFISKARFWPLVGPCWPFRVPEALGIYKIIYSGMGWTPLVRQFSVATPAVKWFVLLKQTFLR